MTVVPLEHAAGPQVVGGKAAALGRLAREGFPVPPGVVIPVEVYRNAVHGLDLPAVVATRGPDAARRLIEAQPWPAGLSTALAETLAQWHGGPVAVRSSATSEDTATASAAGQHDSYLGVVGLSAVTARVRASWGSVWSRRAVAYRQAQGLPDDPGIAVIVQQHLDADVAGVLFGPDPNVADGPCLVEASWGLGESVVQGAVTPDAYVVTATGVAERRRGDKRNRIDRSDSGTMTTEIDSSQWQRLCLTDVDLQRLRELGRKVADSFGGPQDIEFALVGDRIWLLQARPVTVPLLMRTAVAAVPESSSPALLAGTGGSPGLATGPARLVHGPDDFQRVQPGDILVCRCTDPAWTPLFTVAAGVITETGGRLCHAAIVARERRIPAVLGVPAAMEAWSDGQRLTIDGTAGTVRPDTQGSGASTGGDVDRGGDGRP